MPTDAEWQAAFHAAAQAIQPAANQTLTSSGQVVAGHVQGGQPVVEKGPRMREDWEQQFDDFVAARGGDFDVPLISGQVIKVRLTPQTDATHIEISLSEFRNLSRIAAKLNAKVVNIFKREEHDQMIKNLIDRGEGYWANSHCFVEVNKDVPVAGRSGGDGVVSAPTPPPGLPVVDAKKWLVISAGIVKEQVPMRAGEKVLGTLLKTIHGPLYARSAGLNDHRLYVCVDWAYGGGFTIDKEMFYAHLTDPATVIKITRGSEIFFTTSDHIQKYGGIISSWGREKVVMPLRGKYWLVVSSSTGVAAE